MSSNRPHPGSLLRISTHNPELLDLLGQPVSCDMISYIAQTCKRIINVADEPKSSHKFSLPTPPHTPHKPSLQEQQDVPSTTSLPSLEQFIIKIAHASNVQPATLLTTVIYLERLNSKLPTMAKGMACTRHRVFLATLIVAAKYLNDSSPKNKHWAAYASIFAIEEINLMERQLLYLLNYDLRFDEAEACERFAPMMPSSTGSHKERRAAAVEKVTKASKARQNQIQLPPTPPHDSVLPSLPSPAAIKSIAKRLSNAYLSVPVVGGRPRSASGTSSSSAASGSSGTDSAGSFAEDCGTSTSSSSSVWSPAEEEDIGDAYDATEDEEDYLDRKPSLRRFILKPVPSQAYRQGRKSSGSSVVTVMATSSPVTAAKPFPPFPKSSSSSCAGTPISPSPSPLKRVVFDPEPKPRGRTTHSGKRSSSYFYGQGQEASESFVSGNNVVPPNSLSVAMSASMTLPTMARNKDKESSGSGSGAGNFLSRMWGAATKVGSEREKDRGLYVSCSTGLPDINSDATSTYGTTSAFRRLVHSKSAMFRGTHSQSQALDV